MMWPSQQPWCGPHSNTNIQYFRYLFYHAVRVYTYIQYVIRDCPLTNKNFQFEKFAKTARVFCKSSANSTFFCRKSSHFICVPPGELAVVNPSKSKLPVPKRSQLRSITGGDATNKWISAAQAVRKQTIYVYYYHDENLRELKKQIAIPHETKIPQPNNQEIIITPYVCDVTN